MWKTLIAATLLSSSAYAEELVRVDRLTKAETQYLYQGWPDRIAHCAMDVISEIKSMGSEDLWVVDLDEHNESLKFAKISGTNLMICEHKGLREVGTGARSSQIYNHLLPYED